MMDDAPLEKPGYWAVLPAKVRYDPELPANAKLLYAEISALSDQTGYCYATNKYFQELYGLSERTVQGLIRALRNGGYILIADGSGGSDQRKIYAGVNPLTGTPANFCGGPPQKFAPPPADFCGGDKVSKQDNLTEPPKAPQRGRRAKREKDHCDYEPELFERFWKMYPRGEDKAKARFEWDELKPDPALMQAMSAALKRQLETDEWRRGVGIPYACRWLSNRRWEAAEKLRAQAAEERSEAIWL